MDDILETMIEAAREASAEVMKIYDSHFSVGYKEDSSPVTEADLASDRVIREKLRIYRDFGFLSEEEKDDLSRLGKHAIFIVDPLDGTQDFVERDGSFGINIAMVVDHEPVLAVIALPSLGKIAYAKRGEGSYLIDLSDDSETRMHVSSRLDDLIILASRTHELESERDIYLRHPDLIREVRRYGASTKAVLLASGEGDVSIRYTDQTKEWDVCAPDLIVREAGGIFTDTELRRFTYNRRDVYNHHGYCMFNRIENTVLLR